MELIEAAKNFAPTSNRSQWIEYHGTRVFLDAYNANPSSMKSSLDGFFDYCSRQGLNAKECCVIMGDMYELGENGQKLHLETASHLNQYSPGKVIFIGKFKDDYLEGFNDSALSYQTTKELGVKGLLDEISSMKAVFIKGSRSLQLESLLDITI